MRTLSPLGFHFYRKRKEIVQWKYVIIIYFSFFLSIWIVLLLFKKSLSFWSKCCSDQITDCQGDGLDGLDLGWGEILDTLDKGGRSWMWRNTQKVYGGLNENMKIVVVTVE